MFAIWKTGTIVHELEIDAEYFFLTFSFLSSLFFSFCQLQIGLQKK